MTAVGLTIMLLFATSRFRMGRILLLNAFVIFPLNTLVITAYFVLTPLRWVTNHTINFLLTPLVSLFSIRPSWLKADLSTFTAATIVGYKLVFPGPTSILDLPADVVIQRFASFFSTNPVFVRARSWVRGHVSQQTLGSTWFRLLMAYIEIPTLAWWLVGLSWVSFIPLRADSANHANCPAAGPTRPSATLQTEGQTVVVQYEGVLGAVTQPQTEGMAPCAVDTASVARSSVSALYYCEGSARRMRVGGRTSVAQQRRAPLLHAPLL
jgi:hypothetical protein